VLLALESGGVVVLLDPVLLPVVLEGLLLVPVLLDGLALVEPVAPVLELFGCVEFD
jgi:hypothetical protein